MSTNRNMIYFIRVVGKWRKWVMGFVLTTLVVTIVVTLLMPNYYESVAEFYPYNLASYDRAIVFSTESSDKVINYFGDKNDVDRLVAVCKGGPIKEKAIRHFNLASHYDRDTTSRLGWYKVRKEFEDNYSASKNAYGNVEVVMLDKDPKMAAEIANFIMWEAGDEYAKFVTERNSQILEGVESQFQDKSRQLTMLTDSVSTFSDTSTAYYRLIARQQSRVLKEFNDLKTIREQYKLSASQKLPAIQPIQVAQPAMKKTKPVRSLIVAGATLAALIFILLLVLIIEKYREIRSEMAQQYGQS